MSDAEARARLQEEGPNEIAAAQTRSLWRSVWEVVREPMLLLLLAAGAIYLLLGDLKEALVLLLSVFVVIGISLSQNRKTDRALAALRDLASPRALVLREGRRLRIPSREVVRGDLLLLSEGDRIPADCRLEEASGLSADESLLTGESVPVRKAVARRAVTAGNPEEDQRSRLFSGTLLVSGCAIASVEVTGPRTEIGKIGRSLDTILAGKTRLQKETDRVVRRVALLGAALCLVVAVVYALTRGSWLDGLLAGLALAMALLPEEFPVVLTIFLAIGAWRISRRQVLTRHLPAIESLGAATVLCVDKTGTLTQNRMSVRRLWSPRGTVELGGDAGSLPEAVHEVVELGILASRADPFDPMERAIRELGSRLPADFATTHADWEAVAEFPLARTLLATTFVWRAPNVPGYVVASKGAPEAIAELCRLSPEQSARLLEQVRRLADDGLRVLGVARASVPTGDPPEEPRAFVFELAGLIGLADPLRPTVPAAVRECHKAGIRVVMITGDYPVTAVAIARQAGLASRGAVSILTGAELEAMDEDALRRRIGSTDVFARVAPEQKLRLVRSFQATGEVVAMTGDGVNDAPALKAADMGIAMGQRGTDVAREAADLVLLEDDFSSIVDAIGLGRRIFDNVRKAVAYILAIHVPIAGISLAPVLLGWPLALLPLHIVFLELIIDPACSLVFEAEESEADVMRRPPRHPEEALFSRRTVALALFQGVGVLAVVLAVYASALKFGRGAEAARAMAFATLIAANLSLILTNRSWSRTFRVSLRSPNAALAWVAGGALALLGATLSIPELRELFRFGRLPAAEVLLCMTAGFASVLWFEAWKAIRPGWNRPGPVQ